MPDRTPAPNEVKQEEQACLTHPEIDVMAEIRKSQTAIISALRQEFTGLPVALGGALQAMQANPLLEYAYAAPAD